MQIRVKLLDLVFTIW